MIYFVSFLLHNQMPVFNISALECVWYKMNNYEQEKEFVNLLDIVIRVQCFLQVRFHLFSIDAIILKIFFGCSL